MQGFARHSLIARTAATRIALAASLAIIGSLTTAHAQELETHRATADTAPTTAIDDETASLDAASETTGTGILPSFVIAGAIDPNKVLPLFNGVAGAGVANFDFAVPATVLTHGTSYVIAVGLQDFNITGDYEVDYYITQKVGKKTKTILQQTIETGGTTAPGEVFAWVINSSAIPDSVGVATLTGRVRWGTNYSNQAIVSTTIYIQ